MTIFEKPIYDIENKDDDYFNSFMSGIYASNNVIEAELMKNGFFIKVTEDVKDIFGEIEDNNDILTINDVRKIEGENPLILTKRHKLLMKKALFVRIFLGVLYSDIKSKDFLEFISSVSSNLYTNNINAFDFNMIAYGKFFANNSNGNKEIGVAQYIDIPELIGYELTEQYCNEIIYLFEVDSLSNDNIMPFIYKAAEAAKENRHI